MSSIRIKDKYKDQCVTEQECMSKFYKPINSKKRIMNKWLKPPKR